MKLRRLQPHEGDEAARLIHAALDTWYRQHLNSPRFGDAWEPFRVFQEVYEALDPGCCLVAEDEADELAGCLFYHPRPTHVGVGIVATHPACGGRGVARKLMEAVLHEAAGKPLRLVSSAMNLDSFSLYTKLGFVPQQTFQDLSLEVPAEGLPGTFDKVRKATREDVRAMEDLEFRLSGIRREQDFQFFLRHPEGPWRVMVRENAAGQLTGYLTASTHESCRMLGPGVAEDAAVAAELIHAQLDTHFRQQSVVWLIPVNCPVLVRQGYAWGARNVELHLSSVLGTMPTPMGITIPTFLPESG